MAKWEHFKNSKMTKMEIFIKIIPLVFMLDENESQQVNIENR